MIMQPDKLMIVAHPDDEVLWGGLNLLSQPGWFVVCSTHANHPVRSQEFYKTMKMIGNDIRFKMFDVPDIFTYSDVMANQLYDGTPFDDYLKELATQTWTIVVSHNEVGEYGHAHHRKVHRMVKRYFQTPVFFTTGPSLPQSVLVKKRELLKHYTSQICPMAFYTWNDMSRPFPEREYFYREVVFLPPKPPPTSVNPLRLTWLNRRTS